MTRRRRRLILVSSAGAVLSVAAALVVFAFSNSFMFSVTPSQLAEFEIGVGDKARILGLVEDGSLERSETTHVNFVVTDLEETVTVSYNGILPDLFREGQGVIVEGTMTGPRMFEASTVLARHDENYMPKEVADALKEQGVWKDQANF